MHPPAATGPAAGDRRHAGVWLVALALVLLVAEALAVDATGPAASSTVPAATAAPVALVVTAFGIAGIRGL